MSNKSVIEGINFDEIRVNIILRRIAEYCKTRAIDLYQAFSKVDTRRNFKLSEKDWYYGFSLINIPQKILSENEKVAVTDYFRTVDGTINYLTFCNAIDNAAYYFHCNDDEQSKQTTHPDIITCKGWLPLDIEEDCMFYDLMTKMSAICCQNSYDMREYGEEIDKVSRYGPGKITVEHFSKILFKLGIYLKPIEFSVILKKFMDYNHLINFKLFCECMNTLGETMGRRRLATCANELLQRKDKAKRQELRGKKPARELLGYNENDHPLNRYLEFNEDIKTLIFRIHDHLYKHSIRDFTEYFKERDPLNFGTISPEQFLSILNMLGIGCGTLGTLSLTLEECIRLMFFYEDEKEKGRILWREFYNDLNNVWCYRLGTVGRSPDILLACDVGPQFGFQSLNERGTKYNNMNIEERIEFENIINHDMAQKTDTLINKPLIYQFDKEKNNHMLISRFRAAMDNLGRRYSNREMELLEAKYYNQYGFNYRKYLNDVRKATEANERILETKVCDKPPRILVEKCETELKRPKPVPSLLEVMNKIRYHLQVTNTEIWQFLNQRNKSSTKRYILDKQAFHSALTSAGALLSDDEVEVLFRAYRADTSPGEFIDYKTFFHELERLDRVSLLFPGKQFPPEQVDFIDYDNKRIEIDKLREVEKIVDILAKKFSETSISELDFNSKRFMDFDRFVRELAVTLNISGTLSCDQLMLVFRAFSKPFGFSNAINFDDFMRHLRRIRMTNKDIPQLKS
ncbi:hypothetical protein O3M35_000841 [Rhynocoris fuscipes]|uniref:EF-hand domain-containing protein n=1 Tax=Rhynocoris fuscipes TaxID=488301 RepID=A0AAW1DSC8_9HEMI